jgi:Putative phage serine protease XkdF
MPVGDSFAAQGRALGATGNASSVSIKKFDEEQQLVYGVVHAPGFPDSQGDFMTRETICGTALEFLRKGLVNHIDVEHSRQQSACYVVESFIARDGSQVPGCLASRLQMPVSGSWSSEGSSTPSRPTAWVRPGRQQLQEVRRPADGRLLGEAQAHGRAQFVRRRRTMALTPERLKELMDYDPLTGFFTAKVRTGGRVVPGTVLGTNNGGYVRISVDGKLRAPAGVSVDDRVHTFGGIRGNNRWANLRDVTHPENAINCDARKTNKLGIKGVHELRARFRKESLGCFLTKEAAHKAYLTAGGRI